MKSYFLNFEKKRIGKKNYLFLNNPIFRKNGRIFFKKNGADYELQPPAKPLCPPPQTLRNITKSDSRAQQKHKCHGLAFFIALINGLLAQDLFCIIYSNLKCGQDVFLSIFSETRFAKIYYIIIDQRISLSYLQNYILLLLLG